MENRKEQSINIQLPKSITEDTVENVFKIHLNEEIVELARGKSRGKKQESASHC